MSNILHSYQLRFAFGILCHIVCTKGNLALSIVAGQPFTQQRLGRGGGDDRRLRPRRRVGRRRGRLRGRRDADVAAAREARAGQGARGGRVRAAAGGGRAPSAHRPAEQQAERTGTAVTGKSIDSYILR